MTQCAMLTCFLCAAALFLCDLWLERRTKVRP